MKETEINLSLNNFDLVCLNIEEKRKKFNQNLFWRKIEIFCQILNNETNKANLSLTLLKENKNFNDEILFCDLKYDKEKCRQEVIDVVRKSKE